MTSSIDITNLQWENIEKTFTIHGKHHRPSNIGNGKYIARPRLIEKLDTYINLPLTIVRAPPGYGKTTLVDAWAEKSSIPIAWLSLDDDDNDPLIFVKYLVEALRTTFPEILKKTHALVGALISPPFYILSKCLVSEINELSQNMALVIDNYEVINNPQINELITAMLRYPNPQLRILLLTHHDPRLPVGNLRAHNLLGEITISNLLFSREEARALFSDEISSGKLDEAQFENIFQQMEGWVTGLSLYAASLASDEEGTSAAIDWASCYIKEYLSSKLFFRITALSLDLLCQASIANELCEGLCDALFQYQVRTVQSIKGASFIRRLITDNFFFSPSDSEPGWYRFHPVFKTALYAYLEENYTTDEIEHLHTSAAYWYARHGKFKDALYHAQKIDAGVALDIFCTYYLGILEQCTLRTVEEWLSLFPASIVDNIPELLFAKTWIMLESMRLLETNNLLGKVESILNVSENGSLEEWETKYKILRAMYFVRMGNTALALDFLQSLDGVQLPEDFLREVATAARLLAYRLTGNEDKCAVILRNNIAFTRTDGNSLHLLPSICTLNTMKARLEDTERTAYLMLEISRQRNNKKHIGIASLHLGVVAYHKNELQLAKRYFLEALELEEFFNIERVITCYLGLAAAERALGNYGKTYAMIEKAKSLLTSIHNLDLLPYIDIFDTEIKLRQGLQVHQVHSTLPEWILLWTDILHHPALTVCHQNIRKGQESCVETLALLGNLFKYARSKGNKLLSISVAAHTALALEASKNSEKANEFLKKALNLAEQTDCLRIFLDLGVPMARLLQQSGLPRTGITAELMDAFSRETPMMNDDIKKTLKEHLTEQELHILGYLSQRFSNKEIADYLCITPATVKSHTIHIYQKLSVNSRREAVEKAKNLGFFAA